MATSSARFPRPVLLGAFAAAVLSMVAAGLGHGLGGHEQVSGALPAAELDFRVADRADGAVLVLNARDGREVAAVTGEAGFLRGTLRALARERRMEKVGGTDAAFRLIGWNDGRLTLDDTATGARIELVAFGPDNVAVFARLLAAQGGK